MKVRELKQIIDKCDPETEVTLLGDEEGWYEIGEVKQQPLSDLFEFTEKPEVGDTVVLNITRQH